LFTLRRRILPAVTQLFSFLADYGDTLETAFHRPRIDASEGALVIGDTALARIFHQNAEFRVVPGETGRARPVQPIERSMGKTGMPEMAAPNRPETA
jgi:hypothetical protein